MRNLIEYPVTKEELLNFLNERIKEEQVRIESQMICGDMTLVYLQTLKDLCDQSNLCEQTN